MRAFPLHASLCRSHSRPCSTMVQHGHLWESREASIASRAHPAPQERALRRESDGRRWLHSSLSFSTEFSAGTSIGVESPLRPHQSWKPCESLVPLARYSRSRRVPGRSIAAPSDSDFRANRRELGARWRAGAPKGNGIERDGARRNVLPQESVLVVLTDHRFCVRTVSHTSRNPGATW